MISNKTDSAGTSLKFITPREKKIGDLAQVLERQRLTIKTLLSSKKDENLIKRDHTVYTQIDRIDTRQKTQMKQPEKYQQLCDQILNIGSKLLSGRKPCTLQSYRDAHSELELKQIRGIKQVPEQKSQEGDEEMNYLKSDEYRLYLQNLTKDQDSTKVDLLKRMKETRNNNVYTKPFVISKVFKNLQPKSSTRDQKSYRDFRDRETEFVRKRQILQNIQPVFSVSSGLIGRKREYQRSSNISEQISILPINNLHLKEMRHSPTMKDINKPTTFQMLAKKQQKASRSVSKNNKIQSGTVDCLVFTGLTPPKNLQNEENQDVKKKTINEDSPKLFRHQREWDVKIECPNFNSKDQQSQFHTNSLKKNYGKSHVLKESYSYSNIKKQTFKPESNYIKKSKNSYETHQKNRRNKVVILEQSNHQFSDFGDLTQVNIQNVNLYELNFKLADPRTIPHYYQTKTPDKICKQKNPSKANQKQNIYFTAKIVHSCKPKSAKTPKKQLFQTKQIENVIPYCIDFPQNKKWKLQESQTTSTVTKSAYDQQIQTRMHSRSKSKLSIVTASKKQKR